MNIYVVHFSTFVVGVFTDEDCAKILVEEAIQKFYTFTESDWKTCPIDKNRTEFFYRSSRSGHWNKSEKYVTEIWLEMESAL